MDAELINAEEVQKIIASIRDENNETNWVLIGYENPKSQKLVLVGSGNGGVEEMKGNFTDDRIFFGLVREFDQIDDSKTVKFAFIEWIGDKSSRLQKGRVTMQLTAIQNIFGQFHVSHMCSKQDEISEDIVINKIKSASGSANHVLN